MNPKRFLLLLAFVVVVGGIAAAALTKDDPMLAPATAGRFALVTGKTFVVADETATDASVILKVDTATGKTWLLVLMKQGATNTLGFKPVGDL